MNQQTNAIFFISTGRCGTQWFADKLAEHYSDIAEVVHEPYLRDYQPRKYFQDHFNGKPFDKTNAVQKHLNHIESVLETKNYVEAGWPCYGILPYLIEHFRDRVKVVHLYRHPIKIAASQMTLNHYRRGEWSDYCSLTSKDQGVWQSELAGEPWEKMGEFEKCLFWATEINYLANKLKKEYPDIPWLTIKFEDLFSKENNKTIQDSLIFFDFPHRQEFFDTKTKKKDIVHHKTEFSINIELINKYPKAQELMHELGYTIDEINPDEMKARYQLSPPIAILKKIKKTIDFKVLGKKPV